MEPDPCLSEVQAVAAAIRRYLDRHPQAIDTAEGIQRWWLAPDYGEVSLHTVEAALKQLERDGEVSRLEQAWSAPSFRRTGGTTH